MITANKGDLKIRGTNYDILFEFNQIIGALQQDNPEIVLGAISAWSSILESKLDDVDKLTICAISHMSEDIIKGWLKGEDND